jgi:hypothetical protein
VQVENLRPEPGRGRVPAAVGRPDADPARGKKFSNLYRLVRIGIPTERLAAFVGTPQDGGPYQAAALVLAILISDAGHARDVVAQLHNAGPDIDILDALGRTWGGFRSPRTAVTTTSPAVKRLRATIAELRREGAVVHAAPTSCARAIARYSFETYQLYTEPDPAEPRT